MVTLRWWSVMLLCIIVSWCACAVLGWLAYHLVTGAVHIPWPPVQAHGAVPVCEP